MKSSLKTQRVAFNSRAGLQMLHQRSQNGVAVRLSLSTAVQGFKCCTLSASLVISPEVDLSTSRAGLQMLHQLHPVWTWDLNILSTAVQGFECCTPMDQRCNLLGVYFQQPCRASNAAPSTRPTFPPAGPPFNSRAGLQMLHQWGRGISPRKGRAFNSRAGLRMLHPGQSQAVQGFKCCTPDGIDELSL